MSEFSGKFRIAKISEQIDSALSGQTTIFRAVLRDERSGRKLKILSNEPFVNWKPGARMHVVIKASDPDSVGE